MIALLHNQHAQQIALVNNGRTQKRVKGLFTQTLDPLKLGVCTGIVQIERLFPGRHPAHQTFIKAQAKLTHLLGVQALCGAENQLLGTFIVQVDRAHIGMHRRSHLSDN